MTKQVDDGPLLKLCSLWENTSRAGQTYLTGKLNYATRLVIFKNNHKSKDSDPDWNVFLRQDEPKEAPK